MRKNKMNFEERILKYTGKRDSSPLVFSTSKVINNDYLLKDEE
jgi:hypothetical protein